MPVHRASAAARIHQYEPPSVPTAAVCGSVSDTDDAFATESGSLESVDCAVCASALEIRTLDFLPFGKAGSFCTGAGCTATVWMIEGDVAF